MEAVRTSPAIQWMVTHANLIPAIGRKAVKSSTNIAPAITQWNNRAASEWRGMRSGRVLKAASRRSVWAQSRFRRGQTNM